MIPKNNEEISLYKRIIAELSVTTELATLSFSDSLKSLAEEVSEKAVRLFNLRSFAFLSKEKGELREVSLWGFKNVKDVLRKAKENKSNQIKFHLGKQGKLGLLFMEQVSPVTVKERKLYLLLARKVEDALMHMKITQERKSAEKELRVLYKTATILNSGLELDQTLEKIVDAINEVIGFHNCSLHLLDKERNVLVLKIIRGAGSDYWKLRKIVPIGKYEYNICGLAALDGEPHYVRDLMELDFPEEVKKNVIEKYNLRSYLCIPIKFKEEVLGVISIMSQEYRKFSENERGLLSTFADQAGQAIARTRILDSLRDSEEKYRTMVESANDLIWILDRKGNFIYSNKRAEEVSGYKFKDWEGKSFAPLIVPEDLPDIQRVFKKTLAGKPQSYRVRVYKKDGGIFILSVNTAPIFEKGKAVGTISFGRDITERVEMERKISAIYELNQKMALSLDMDEITTAALDTIENILNFTSSSLLLIDEEKNELYIKGKRGFEIDIRLPLNGGKGVTVWVARTGKPIIIPDTRKEPRYVKGKRMMLSEMAVPLVVKGKVLGVLNVENERLNAFGEEDLKLLQTLASGIATAIENIRLLENLRESEKLYKSLFELNENILENSPIGIIKLDNELKISYENPEMKIIIGVHPGKESKAMEMDIRKIPSVKKAGISSLFNKLLKGEKISKETFFESIYGKRTYISLRGAPIFEGKKFKGAIITVEDITEKRRTEEELKKSLAKLRKSLIDTADALSAAVESRDPYTAGHQRRVTQLACAIAREMGLPEEQIEGLKIAGLLHDIGKISIPSEILSKPAKLNEIEFELMKSHPSVGYEILKKIDFPWPVAEIVLQHHERLNGSGYPQGLKGDDILLEARILGVADVVEAMSSHRPYRPALGIDKALEEISKNKGILYDPQVVEACLKLFSEKKFKFADKGLNI